ncbi:hypothetical protein F511_32417 [Dorcoceras hygrometricum]|uniref:Uncharacterized protein n=1 Tax=Dorcoceras hygrometricum TaxID=472368 RepID=A0A2Z7BTF2_9LAMI|nr:hypothetical protein F511_32417 [Dorcoceras hygrometricum]
MVHVYRKLSQTFEEIKVENNGLKNSSEEPSTAQLGESDSLQTELSKLKIENEYFRTKSCELSSGNERLNHVMSSWTKSSISLSKLHETQKPLNEKCVLGFSFGESSSEETCTQSDLADDKLKKMNFVKASVIHDVYESVKYDDQFTGQLNHKGKNGIGYIKPENCKPSWLKNRLDKDKAKAVLKLSVPNQQMRGSTKAKWVKIQPKHDLNGQMISCVQGKFVEIYEEQFTSVFELPSEGLMLVDEVPKDLIKEARTAFSASGEPIKTSCKKKEMNVEFRLLNDILAKTVMVKAGSFDAVTHEQFLLMVAIHGGVKNNWRKFLFDIQKAMVTKSLKQVKGFAAQICVILKEDPDLTLGESKTFPPLRILTVKTVGTYVSKNKPVSTTAEEVTDETVVEKVVKAAWKRRSAPTDEPVAKKKRTTVGRADPKEKTLEIPEIQYISSSSSSDSSAPTSPRSACSTSSSSSSSASRMHFTDDIPQASQIAMPNVVLPTNFTESIAQLQASIDHIKLEQLSTHDSAWLRPVSRGNRHFTVGGGRLRQSGPRPKGRLLRQPALESLTRSARTDSPRQVGRNKFRRSEAAAACTGGGGVRTPVQNDSFAPQQREITIKPLLTLGSRTPQNPLPMLNTLISVSVRESRIQYLCDPQWFRDTASRGPTTIVAPESQFRTCPSDHGKSV